MKQLLSMILAAVAALLLVACGKPAPIESVESLVANPEGLIELRAQCKADHAKVGDAICGAVSEATRRRFMGDGKSPYANDPVPKPVPPAQLPPRPARCLPRMLRPLHRCWPPRQSRQPPDDARHHGDRDDGADCARVRFLP